MARMEAKRIERRFAPPDCSQWHKRASRDGADRCPRFATDFARSLPLCSGDTAAAAVAGAAVPLLTPS